MSDKIKPRYEVEKLDGTKMKTVAKPKVDPERKDKNGNALLLGGFDYEQIEVDAGWMVYFPSGSSIHVWTEEEMKREGFDIPPELVNMETGELSAPNNTVSLKENSARKTHVSRNSQSAQT